jgi:hypothetical protein
MRTDKSEKDILAKLLTSYHKVEYDIIGEAYALSYKILQSMQNGDVYLEDMEIQGITESYLKEKDLSSLECAIYQDLPELKQSLLLELAHKKMVKIIQEDEETQNDFGIYQQHILNNKESVLREINGKLDNYQLFFLFYIAIANLKFKNMSEFERNTKNGFLRLGVTYSNDPSETRKKVNELDRKAIRDLMFHLLNFL